MSEKIKVIVLRGKEVVEFHTEHDDLQLVKEKCRNEHLAGDFIEKEFDTDVEASAFVEGVTTGFGWLDAHCEYV